jgi:hypothetical protein
MFEWSDFVEYKLWKLVALGILAFVGGWYGLFNSRSKEAARHDKELD